MSALVVLAADGELRISSMIVAERTGVEHRAVLQLVRNNSADFEMFGRVAFEMQPFETAGGVQRREVAHLNEQQATLLITYMRNSEIVRAFKLELVKQFYEMRQALERPAVPQTFAEALEAAAAEARKVEALEAQAAIDAPKVEYVDTFVADEDLRLIRNVAKDIGVTEDALRRALVDHEWIYAQQTTRWSNRQQKKVTVTRYSPYASKADYFRTTVVHDAPRFRGEVMHTVKVTPAGAIAIARMASRWGLTARKPALSIVEASA